ncbi:hypothetical protein pb186bvf_018873 [Paramecium bursaria]
MIPQKNFVLCINCENYILLPLAEQHTDQCYDVADEVKYFEKCQTIDHVQFKLGKLRQPLQFVRDIHTVRALELLELIYQCTTDKEIKDYVDETAILAQISRNFIILRLSQLAEIKDRMLPRLSLSQNSRTRDSFERVSKEEILKKIESKRIEIEQYKHMAQSFRWKALQSQNNLEYIAGTTQGNLIVFMCV